MRSGAAAVVGGGRRGGGELYTVHECNEDTVLVTIDLMPPVEVGVMPESARLLLPDPSGYYYCC